jgi:preprotein translocase SecF subunit
MNTVAETIKEALAKKHPGEGGFEILSVESVGPKVGAELRRRGFLAVACTTLFMGIYIAFRFELSFGIGAVIALAHDVLIVLLALVLSRTIFDLTTLAGMLTVIGFSVHDTIIVSDRVREDLRKMRRSSLAEVINLSINETLSRTILTTGTALLVLLALYFLGGPGLQPFASRSSSGSSRHLLVDLHRGAGGPLLVEPLEARRCGLGSRAPELQASRRSAKHVG